MELGLALVHDVRLEVEHHLLDGPGERERLLALVGQVDDATVVAPDVHACVAREPDRHRVVYPSLAHLPDATQVADPFHVVKLANSKLDECRRRVQNETLGHRGRKNDPLYRSRRLLTKGHERLDERGEAKLLGLLEAGDPGARCASRGTPKRPSEASTPSMTPTRPTPSSTSSPTTSSTFDHPPEVRSLGRTLRRWRHQIVAWHRSRVSNGPIEAANNLIKRIKRVGFGFRCFAHYRLRVLLYAGRPNWNLINIIDAAQIR